MRKNNVKKLDFDCRVSQQLSLPYKDYSENDANALELLKILQLSNSYSLEWCREKKRFALTVDSIDGKFGQMFYGTSISNVVTKYFEGILT